jgi:hypothetical protein
MDDESTRCSIPELMPRGEHDDAKLTKCFNIIFVPSKSDEESINTCEMDEEYINATNSDNKWLEEWLIYKGASGNVTYSDDKIT